MSEHVTVPDAPAVPMDLSVGALPVEAPSVAEAADLEQRVHRLEEAVTGLQDTEALEERVALRVTEKLKNAAPSEQFTAAPPSPEPYPDRFERGSHAWLFYEMAADARLMFLMFLDRRYTMAWTTHLVIWLFTPAILFSAWWFPFA